MVLIDLELLFAKKSVNSLNHIKNLKIKLRLNEYLCQKCVQTLKVKSGIQWNLNNNGCLDYHS